MKTFLNMLKRFNWISFAVTILLITVGCVAIYSAGHARETLFHNIWKSNLNTAIFSLVIYFALAFFDYRKFLRWFSIPSYAGAILMLIVVLIVGTEVYGGKRWLWFFQPSEISKLCVISVVAYVFGMRGENLRGFKGFAIGSALLGAPALLILLEPDLGTTLTLIPAVVAMLLAAKVWRTGLLICIALCVVLSAGILCAVYEAEKPGVESSSRQAILRCVPLKKHQVKRVKTFLYPESDPLGDGYTLRQSKISIGSGGFLGKGIGKGETNHLKFLPPSISMNDFIFCVWAEETGYIGSIVLIALFAVLCLSGVWVAITASDLSGRILALGVSTLIFAHVYINIAMCIGLLPITGLPLPFISSGRTFLVTVLAGLGLIQSVSIHKKGNIIQ
jgi:rod shape determining protein RodA